MPEYIKVLIALLTIGSGVFYFSKPLFVDFGMTVEKFNGRWKIWCLLTMAAFLSTNYWIFLAVFSFLLIHAKKNEENPVSLFFFILFVLPIVRAEIPGIAGVRYLFEIDNIRVAVLVLLLPVYMRERGKKSSAANPFALSDNLLIGYFLWTAILKFRSDDFIGVMRYSIYCILDIGLPYFAISRGLKDLNAIKQVLADFSLSGIVVATIAIFEFGKHWLLYKLVPDALGLQGDPFYLERGDFARAVVTSGQPIVLGYELVAIFGAFIYFYDVTSRKTKYLFLLLVILCGEIATLSKGPWVGQVLLILAMILLAKNRFKYLVYAMILTAILAIILTASDSGNKIVDYLPFIGSKDEGSYSYRQLLFKKSMESIYDNPLTGSVDYLYGMEELRQGEGIIDLVNTYLMIALDTGLIGLSLFFGCILLVFNKIYSAMNRYKRIADEGAELIAKVLMSTILALLLILAVCSPISTIQISFTMILSLAIAYNMTSLKTN